MFTREDTSSLLVPETKFSGPKGELFGQLVVTVEQISTPLAHLFNMSLHEGCVPLYLYSKKNMFNKHD